VPPFGPPALEFPDSSGGVSVSVSAPESVGAVSVVVGLDRSGSHGS